MLKTLTVTTLLFLALVSGVDADVSAGPFDPVPKSHWAYKTVERFNCSWCRNLESWDSAHMRTISRYEFAVITARVCAEIADSEKAKREVTSLQLSALMRLIEEFAPLLTAIGADATALKRDLPSVLSATRPELDLEKYSELAETPHNHWAYEPINRLYELGIFEGCPTR